MDYGNTRFDRDLSWDELQRLADRERASRPWHPAVRLLIIVGGAATLWALIFAAIF